MKNAFIGKFEVKYSFSLLVVLSLFSSTSLCGENERLIPPPCNTEELIRMLDEKGVNGKSAGTNKARTFLIPLENYRKMRDLMKNPKEEWMKKSGEVLLRAAENVVGSGPWSVMDKDDAMIAPSGDKHDFVSYSMYHWKNADGNWVWRDGEKNPDMQSKDEEGLYKLLPAVRTLTWAGYVFEKPEYMQRAAFLLRTWFLDEKTAMKPNLEFAGGIPGKISGRGVGIHRMSQLPEILDCVGLLQDAGYWTDDDHRRMLKWMSGYLDWAETSVPGKEERAQKNNHSVFYGYQMLACALYCGKTRLAAFYLNEHFLNMLKHLNADGSAPAELARTRPEPYVFYNMDGFIRYAEVARNTGFDLYNFRDGRGVALRNAFEWLKPVLNGEKTFPEAKVKDRPLRAYNAFKTCRLGTLRLKDPVYEKYLRKRFAHEWEREVQNILWPPAGTEGIN